MKKILFTILFILTTNANAQQAEVKDFVNNLGNQIISIANKQSLSEEAKKKEIVSLIEKSVDTDWIARFVLGKNYRNINEEQKSKFIKIYREFMINTYGPKFKSYNGKKFEVIEVSEQNGFFIAKSEFLPKDSNVAIKIDFRVKNRDGKLLIVDFVAEGISLIETQRSEFNSAISQSGFDKFMNDFEEKNKKNSQK
jgi:phospholipid transport system substrate-binding protein